MKIDFSSQILQRQQYQSLSKKADKNNIEQKQTVTNLNNMPNHGYLINFGSKNKNLESLYTYFGDGKGMPVTYNLYLSAMPKESREKITDVYANYKSVYAEMENCHTAEELKEKFPDEFGKLQSALAQEDSKGSFLTQINAWARELANNDMFLFPETKDNDLSVYLAKKIYFEAKTKKEINEDFANDINRDIFKPDDIEALKSKRSKADSDDIIPTSVYLKLGLVGDFHSNGFRSSLFRSRKEYIEKYGSIYKERRKATFEKALTEVVENKEVAETSIPRKNSTNYEKFQYAMYYVWNNSMELRKALSDFLIKNSLGNELLQPNFLDINSQKASNQKKVMVDFWEQNPELRADFSDKCKEAFDVIEKAIDTGSFEDLKSAIDGQRQAIFETMKLEKEEREAEILAEQERLAQEKMIKQKIAEAEAFLQERKQSVKKKIINRLKEISIDYPIPKDMIYPIATELMNRIDDKLDETCSIEPLEDLISNYLQNIRTRVENATCTTFFDIFEPIKKGVIEDCCKRAMAEEKDAAMIPVSIRIEKTCNEIRDTAGIFIATLFRPYLAYILSADKDLPKDIRNRECNKIYDNCIKMPEYKIACKTKAQQYIFGEFKKMIFKMPPEKLKSIYTSNLNKA